MGTDVGRLSLVVGWLPALVVVAVVMVDVLPLGGSVTYEIELGSNPREGDARVPLSDLGHFDGRRSLGTFSYRRLLVRVFSFFVETPHAQLRRDSSVEVEVWFRSSLRVGERIFLAAEGRGLESESPYIYRELYVRGPEEPVRWMSASARWKVSELRLRGGKLQFFLDVPSLSGRNHSAFRVPIERVEITILVPGPLQGISWSLPTNVAVGVGALALVVVWRERDAKRG
ncbi:MAG: hypothetical protein ACE5IJ_03900 [Thermoplasmata archaeon]